MRSRFTGRLKTPSPAMVVAIAALIAALGGTAYAATTTIVNIADPTTPSHVAKVTAGGALTVSGNVSGTVTTEQATPTSYYHQKTDPGDCTPIATAPSGNGLIITDVQVDVYADPTPGAGNNLFVSTGAGCTTTVGDVNPATVGVTDLTFGPGIALAAGQSLYATDETINAETYANGFTVPSSQVPAAAAPAASHATEPTQDR